MAIMSLGKVLLIEDETVLAEIVRENLETKGFEVMHTTTLSKASLLYRRSAPDIIIIDVMLPDGNGFDWVNTFRQTDSHTPIIFLTSRSQTEDVIRGFEQGGNDYLKKPFSIAELVVRMKALLKKGQQPVLSVQQIVALEIGKMIFYYPAGEIHDSNKVIQLTSREADLLRLLFADRNRSVNRNEILQRLWGNTDYFSGRSLDVFISKLRKYLSADDSVKIVNVRGVGYKLVC
jgi:DNA-binding response OmpR family regulator